VNKDGILDIGEIQQMLKRVNVQLSRKKVLIILKV
jgi:hypothetical protein